MSNELYLCKHYGDMVCRQHLYPVDIEKDYPMCVKCKKSGDYCREQYRENPEDTVVISRSLFKKFEILNTISAKMSDAVAKVFEQIEMGDYVDEEGHSIKCNLEYINLQRTLDEIVEIVEGKK